MNISRSVVWLSLSVALLAAVAAGTGLFWQEPGGPISALTIRGETAELYGRGLYRYDSLLAGAGHRGTDAVTLFLGIPLLLGSLVLYRRGSLRGALLLAGMLGYFLYVYATLSVGVAYNALFLLYVALFSASFFAFVLLFVSLQHIAARFSDRLPRRRIAAYLFASGVLTLLVWLEAPLQSLLQGGTPGLLGGYTTLVTHALDLAVIVPAVAIAGAMLLRHDKRGYVIAFPLLVLIIMLVPVITVQTISQLSAGVTFTTPEIVGPIGGFLVLGTLGIWIITLLLRDLASAEHPRAEFRQQRAGNNGTTRAVAAGASEAHI